MKGLKKIERNPKTNEKKCIVKKANNLKKTQEVVKKPCGLPKIHTQEFIDNEANELRKFVKSDHAIYLETFARERGYWPQRISEFCQKSSLFAEALREAKLWQEEKLLRMGLTREWDSSMVRYMMARVCGGVWKASYDKEDADREVVLNVVVNEVRK